MANLAPSSTNLTNVQNDATAALTAIANIPKNLNTGGNMNAITYNTPFNSGSTTGTINSIFPAILGSSNTGGYVGNLYTLVDAAKTAITTISTGADSFNQQTSNFQGGVAALQSTITDFNNFLSNADNNSYSYMDIVSSKKPLINLGVQVVYGVTIGLASMMLLGALLVAFCDKPKCRYLMYFTCFLLFFIGLAGFLMSIIFSIITPAVYFGCQFIDFSLSSSADFDSKYSLIQATSRTWLRTTTSEVTSQPAYPLPVATSWQPSVEIQSMPSTTYHPLWPLWALSILPTKLPLSFPPWMQWQVTSVTTSLESFSISMIPPASTSSPAFLILHSIHPARLLALHLTAGSHPTMKIQSTLLAKSPMAFRRVAPVVVEVFRRVQGAVMVAWILPAPSMVILPKQLSWVTSELDTPAVRPSITTWPIPGIITTVSRNQPTPQWPQEPVLPIQLSIPLHQTSQELLIQLFLTRNLVLALLRPQS